MQTTDIPFVIVSNNFLLQAIKTKQTNICLKTARKTQRNCVKCVKVKNIGTRTTSITFFWCLSLLLNLNIFLTFSTASAANLNR